MAEIEDGASSIDEDEDDNSELLRRLKRWYREDTDNLSDWRERAEEDYGFVAGEEAQWDPRDIDALKAALRPVITFNRIDPLVRSVAGEQINNAQEIRFVPREQGDVKPNELLTSAGEWVRDQCDAEDEEAESFWDATICGIGATETRIDMETDPEEPNATIERIDPLELAWDCNAKKRNLSDSRRIWRIRSNIALSDAKMDYPDEAETDLDATWAKLSSIGKVADQDESRQYELDYKGAGSVSDDDDNKTVTHVQCEWYEYETYYKAVDPFTGETKKLTKEEHTNLQGRVKDLATVIGDPAIKLESVKLRRRVYMQAFIGRTILKKKKSPCPDRYTINFITAFRDRNKGQWYGLVRSMKDPQRWANKWLSQALHIMNSTAKGGIMAERGITENVEQFEKSWAKTDEITWVDDGSLSQQRIEPKPGGQFPQGFYQLMEFAISSIRDVSGINLEMIGMREAGQAASLEYQRRQAGITILAMLFKSMRRYHKNSGLVLLFFIQNYLSDSRLIKVVGQEGAKYVPLVRQADVKYDIIVDEGPTSPNQKERVWGLIGQNFWNLPPEIQLVLLEYSPFPSSVVEKIKQAAQQASQGPAAQMQQQMTQLEMKLKDIEGQLRTAQTDKTKAETAQIVQEIQNPPANGHDPQAELMLGIHAAEADKEVKQQRNQQTFELGQQRLQVEDQRKREESGLGVLLKNQQQEADAQRADQQAVVNAHLTHKRDAADVVLAHEKIKSGEKTAVTNTLLREMFKPKPKESAT